MTDTSALIERRHRVLGARAPLFYDRPLQVVRGEDVWVFDQEGRRYLDAYNNVPHVGHCHARVVDAMCRQARLLNIHTRYVHELILDYAERLASTCGQELSRVMLCCTGTEANELAIRIARAATGNAGIIVSDFSYHGNSTTLAALTTAFSAGEPLSSTMRVVKVPNPYRVGVRPDDGELLEAGLAELDRAIQSLASAGHGVAALLFDTIFSTEGLVTVPPSYVKRAADAIRTAGGLFIADEVQAGLGRTGASMWGFQRHSIVPDLVTLGKPLGNGHPLAGVIARPEFAERFTRGAMYFNTFGGNPVSCAVGLAVLDVLEEENLMDNAASTGDHLKAGLAELAARYPVIGEVRGRGLFIGVELIDSRRSAAGASPIARHVVNNMREAGVLISRIGPDDNVLKIRPPMTFKRHHSEQLVDILDSVLQSIPAAS